ncbi:unnamed protein product [Symbiodinium sp. KB8]|nr:unnamed protein product [Symbiodinium sp. KB8]
MPERQAQLRRLPGRRLGCWREKSRRCRTPHAWLAPGTLSPFAERECPGRGERAHDSGSVGAGAACPASCKALAAEVFGALSSSRPKLQHSQPAPPRRTSALGPSGALPLPLAKVCARPACLVPTQSFDLPRVSLAGPVSRDLSEYRLFTVTAAGDIEAPDLGALPNEVTSPPPDSLAAYASVSTRTSCRPELSQPRRTGIAFYPAAFVLVMILMPLYGCCLMICRNCTCCCCLREKCVCIKCGGGDPTYAECSNCYLGYHSTSVIADDGVAEPDYAYPSCSRWSVRACLVMVAGSIAGLGAMYQLRGNQGMTGALADVASGSADGAAAMVYGLQGPMEELVLATASGPVAALLNQTAFVVRDAVDLQALAGDLACVAEVKTLLPNTTAIRAFLTSTSGALGAVDASLVSTSTVVTSLVGRKQNVSGALDGLAGVLNTFATSTADLQVAFVPMVAAVNNVSGPVNSLVDANYGFLPRILREIDEFASNVPSSGNLTNASTGVEALRDDAMAGSGAAARNNRTQLLGNLAAISSGLAASGNQTRTAELMIEFNNATTALQDAKLLTALTVAVNNTVNVGLLVPPLSSVETGLERVTNATSALGLQLVQDALVRLEASINAIPSFEVLVDELNTVTRVTQVYPCLDGLTTAVQQLNASLFELPPSFSFVSSVKDTVQASVDPVISKLPNTTADIRAAESSIRSVNVSGYTADVARLGVQVDEATSAINISSLVGDVGAVNGATPDRAMVDNVIDLESQLTTVSDGLISDMFRFQAAKEGLLTALAAQQALINNYDGGYCSGSMSACKNGSDCELGQSCTGIGTRRCVAVPTAPCGSCAANDRCNLDNTELTALATGLTSLSTGMPDTGEAVTALSDALDAADIDFGGWLADLATANASIASLPLPQLRGQLATVQANLNTSFDVSTVNATLSDARAQLTTVDFASFEAETRAIDDMVSNNLDSQLPLVRSLRTSVLGLDHFTRFDAPRFVSRLARQTLREAQGIDGLLGLLRAVAAVLDEAAAAVGGNETAAPGETVLIPQVHLNLTGSVNSLSSQLGSLGDESAYAAGAAYYLASLVPDSPLKLVPASDVAGRVFVDANGVRYPDGAVCVSDACLRREAMALSQDPLSDALAGIPGAPTIPAPVSRELLFLAPLAVVLLLLLGALFAVVGPCCCTSWQFQVCPPATMACCSFICTPCMLLFAAVLLPLVMVYSDVCYAAPNAGAMLARASPTALCELAGGNGTSQACALSFPIQMEGASATVAGTVNFEALLDGALGGCGGPDPFAASVDSLGSSVASALGNVTDHLINNQISSVLPLRPALRDAIGAAAMLVPVAATSTFSELETALSCNRVHTVFSSVLNPICCGLYDSVFWLVIPWALIPLILCTAGCTCSIMAMKRLASTPWGPVFDEMRREAANADSDHFDDKYADHPTADAGPEGAIEMHRVSKATHADAAVQDFSTHSPRSSSTSGPRVQPSRAANRRASPRVLV